MAGTTFTIANLAFAAFRSALNTVLNGLTLHGQCRFDYVNSTTCRLTRFNGKHIIINGNVEVIPAAGVDFAVAGLTPETLYRAYVYMNGSTMTGEWATTTHATDSTTGVEIKSGDATRTLVGMACPDTGPVFLDSNTSRRVASWFNRRLKKAQGSISANRTCTTTGSWAELNTEARTWLLSWGESSQIGSIGVFGYTAATSYVGMLGVGLDGSSPRVYSGISTTSNNNLAFGGTSDTISEGIHYATFMAQVSSAGTLTVNSGSIWTLGVLI